MIRFAADENFNNDILRGLRRHLPNLDVVRIQDVVGLSGADDPQVLAWSASEERILLTHDVATITHYAYARLAAGLRMPGVVEVGRKVALSVAIEDIILLAEYSHEGEWEGQILYLPLR
jgi:hypothetical protein